jgi:adenosine deaminase
VRSIDDPELVKLLAARQIPLTVCPLSNIELKVYPNLAAHPVKRLKDAGVLVTLNSDDPPMFHCDVLDNYIAVADTFNLSLEEVEEFARNSFQATFQEQSEKERSLNRFDETASKLKAELWGM